MPHWDGNNYNRKKELPKFLAKLDPEALQKYGASKSRDFMTNYNYNAEDKKIDADKATTPIKLPRIITEQIDETI